VFYITKERAESLDSTMCVKPSPSHARKRSNLRNNKILIRLRRSNLSLKRNRINALLVKVEFRWRSARELNRGQDQRRLRGDFAGYDRGHASWER